MFFAFVFIFICVFQYNEGSIGPWFKPTQGEVWPKPMYQFTTTTIYAVDFSTLQIKLSGDSKSCELLTKSIDRYTNIIKNQFGPFSNDSSNATQIKQIEVTLLNECNDVKYPHADMDESYNLTIAETQSTLRSDSVWGILRGLETLSQLFYTNTTNNKVFIKKTRIVDTPLYSYRGLLVDTSRHFVSKKVLLTILDGMEANKLNVFHWHIVDDQSFPYVSKKYPDLSRKGAYASKAVYTQEDIAQIIQYATERGIRVIPEFDMPGHTSSWGAGYPDILTYCQREVGPMHPIKNDTHTLIRELLQEISEVFPDEYIHLGGDEVNTECWSHYADITEYMREHNIKDVAKMQNVFNVKVLSEIPERSKVIVWEEVFNHGSDIMPINRTIIQSWLGQPNRIIAKGYKVVDSHQWYLDHQTSELNGDWSKFYDVFVTEGLYGGEACMWGELVDDTNILPRIFPRVSAVAERLWSKSASFHADSGTKSRLEEHACRMNARGIKSQPPNGPSYCPYVHNL